MNVLVTGGAGYIGSVVAAHLVAHGHDVVVLDDLSTGHGWAIAPGARHIHADLLDAGSVRQAVTPDLDAVFHFAARSLVAESVAHPTVYFRSNVLGALNLLDAMRHSDVRRLVFSSTAAVYGDPATVPITEDAPTRPTNPYGASKLAIDHLIAGEATAAGLAAVSLRYFNVAGAAYGLGEDHAPETHLIPLALQTAAGMRDALELYGTDYPTPDGSAIRDYIHVSDLATAHVLAMDALSSGGPGHRVYNLGNGAGSSVRQVIAAVREVTGSDVRVVERGRRAGDPAVLVASSDRIGKELGWAPDRPALTDIVGDAWAWMQQRADRPS